MLTAAERVATRREAGYPAAGAEPADALKTALDGLTPEGEAVVKTQFLARTTTLENALWEVAENASTSKAAVWERNANELAEKAALIRHLRLSLCRFLGVEPGPGVGDIPAFTACCKATSSGSSGTPGVDPDALWLPPAVFVV